MSPDVRKLLERAPFVPFTIHLSEGGALRVPTADHAAVTPSGRRVFVFGDNESYEFISPLMITRVTVDEVGPLGVE